MSCDDYMSTDYSGNTQNVGQMLSDTLSDKEFVIAIAGQAYLEHKVESQIAKMGAKSVSKAIAKRLLGLFGGLTNIGDYLDIMDVLVGDNYNMIVDQETFQMIFNGAKDSYQKAFSQEFKNCLRQSFKKAIPSLTEQELTLLVNKTTALTVISEEVPTKQNVFTYYEDCFPTRVINGKTYSSKNLGPTCPMLYKQYFNEYMNSRK
jgi:hypothetical protein